MSVIRVIWLETAQLPQFKMVDPLEKWFRFKSEVFHALWAWELLAVDIHRQRMEVYDSDVMFSQRVVNWYSTFASGRASVMKRQSWWMKKLRDDRIQHWTR